MSYKVGPRLREPAARGRNAARFTQPRDHVTYDLYRVTIQLVQNLPLTSKQKFRFGLA